MGKGWKSIRQEVAKAEAESDDPLDGPGVQGDRALSCETCYRPSARVRGGLKTEPWPFDSVMGSTKRTSKGRDAFDAHFSKIYGERWPQLRKSLAEERRLETINSGLLKAYHLDGASFYPPSLLNIQRGQSVLDVCAAPGGKSLQLALGLEGKGRLVLNELSSARRQRLSKVVEEHLSEGYREIIEIWGRDGSRLGERVEERFDAVLLDAPCSSERHLIENASHLDTWGPKRTKQLAHRQMGLLCSALELLKSGGRMVYSTCSISPEENERLIERFLKKRSSKVSAVEIVDGPGEMRSHGRLILPDSSAGQGPMYACLLERR